jgi:chromosome segregation ATPase
VSLQLAEVHQQIEAHSAGVEKLQGSLAELSAAQAGALEGIRETGRAVEVLHGSTNALQESVTQSENVQRQLLAAEELLSQRMASLHNDQSEHASKASAAWQVRQNRIIFFPSINPGIFVFLGVSCCSNALKNTTCSL